MLMEELPHPPGASAARAGQRWQDGRETDVREIVAEEVPVALVYNGISHVVMLATPHDLAELGLGFSLSEGLVAHASEVHDIEVTAVEGGLQVEMQIAAGRFAALKERRRNLAGRTGCGICGAESVDQAVRSLPRLASAEAIDPRAIHRGFDALRPLQRLHGETGATHAAAWANAEGGIELVREDVGRHNALDKLVGTMAREGRGFTGGFALITSRASSEMVQKAATVGIATLAAISAPTGLAIELANDCGLTLVGFARAGSHVVYARP